MRRIAACFSILFITPVLFGQVKRPEPPPVKVPFARSLQAVVVTTNGWDATTGTAALYERKDTNADWKHVGDGFPVVVGRSGLAWAELLTGDLDMSKIKQEGDGNAPAGLFPLISAFGTATKPAGVALPYTKLDKFTECVNDVRSNFYNKIVNRMHVGNFDWKSSEKLLSAGDEYALGVFVAYNSYPVERGRGSCVFLHAWNNAKSATEGPTAMERRNLERIVGWLNPAKNPYLVQMPSDIYAKRRKTWKLPKLK